MKEWEVVRADPAGNITLFVLTPTERAERPALGTALMKLPGLEAEQVAFVCPPVPGVDGCMEMAAGEFCGNASRAYGMLLARQRGGSLRQQLRLRVSGSEAPITVSVNMETGCAEAQMPLPLAVEEICEAGVTGTLVDLGGIVHLVTEAPPSDAFFQQAEPVLLRRRTPGAYGVCFLSGERMTPLVKVPAAGTLVWEGSCGSGALAAAAAMSRGRPDGTYTWCLRQPAGSLTASVTLSGGGVIAASIDGVVTLDEPVRVTI